MPAKPPTPTPETIEIRWRPFAAEQGICTQVELHRRLQLYGITITSSQLGKVLRGDSDGITWQLMTALTRVLDAPLQKLFVFTPLTGMLTIKRQRRNVRSSLRKAAAAETQSSKHHVQSAASPPRVSPLPKAPER